MRSLCVVFYLLSCAFLYLLCQLSVPVVLIDSVWSALSEAGYKYIHLTAELFSLGGGYLLFLAYSLPAGVLLLRKLRRDQS